MRAHDFSGGGFSPWAKCLAANGFSALKDGMSYEPFWARSPWSSENLWIFPEASSNSLGLTVLYDPKLTHLTPAFLTQPPSVDEIVGDWRRLSRGYVRAAVDFDEPYPFLCRDYKATNRAAEELFRPEVLTRHTNFFDQLLHGAWTYLERWRADHSAPEINVSARTLYTTGHHQPHRQ